MRVLFVCRSFPAHRAGGMEQHALDVVEGLGAAGHEVHVLTTPLPPTPALSPLRPTGLVHELGGATGGSYDLGFFRHLRHRVMQIARTERIQIVHCQGFAGIPLMGLAPPASPPVVTTVHGTLWSETTLDRRARRGLGPVGLMAEAWRFKHRFAFWPLWRLFLASRPAVIVDSIFTARELAREGLTRRPSVVPPGFPAIADEDAPEPARTPGPVRLLAIGRLESVKGFGLLLRALAMLPDEPVWRLTIVGEGPEFEPLTDLAHALGVRDRVELPGRLAPEAVAALRRDADLFCNPDQGQPAFGLTNAEALCAGLPVIASRVGAHPEVIRSGDGVLVPPADAPAWAIALGRLIHRIPEDPARRRARAARARRRFSREAMIRRLVAVYDGLATSA